MELREFSLNFCGIPSNSPTNGVNDGIFSFEWFILLLLCASSEVMIHWRDVCVAGKDGDEASRWLGLNILPDKYIMSLHGCWSNIHLLKHVAIGFATKYQPCGVNWCCSLPNVTQQPTRDWPTPITAPTFTCKSRKHQVKNQTHRSSYSLLHSDCCQSPSWAGENSRMFKGFHRLRSSSWEKIMHMRGVF